MTKHYFTILTFILTSRLAYGQALQNSSPRTKYFVVESGLKINSIHLDFGVATSTVRELSSSKVFLKLIEQPDSHIEQRIQIVGGVCKIGGKNLQPPDVRVLMNDKTSISTSEAKSGFYVSVKLNNFGNNIGPVNCEGFDFTFQ